MFRGVICPVSIIEGVKYPVFEFRGVIRLTAIVQGGNSYFFLLFIHIPLPPYIPHTLHNLNLSIIFDLL